MARQHPAGGKRRRPGKQWSLFVPPAFCPQFASRFLFGQGKKFDFVLLAYFALWYLGNYYYNITNKCGARRVFFLSGLRRKKKHGTPMSRWLVWGGHGASGGPSTVLLKMYFCVNQSDCFWVMYSACVL